MTSLTVSCASLADLPNLQTQAEVLAGVAEQLVTEAADDVETWCIFDNTAAFAATGDALTVRDLVQGRE